jgi:Permuted papain-like amidase enzyme, YaeF/YiiX, C92 family
MRTLRRLRDRLSDWFADYMSRPIEGFEPPAAYSVDQLAGLLQPGDVLLVEGNLRISSVIKYITQSTWSHVAIYVGQQPGSRGDDPPVLVEAELAHGVILSPLSKYVNFHTRICRPIGLRPEDRERVVAHALARVGHGYDLKNVLDLARNRLSRTSVAATLKRGLRALGSGEPTRTICSTLIAQAFQSVRYPILPVRKTLPCRDVPPDAEGDCVEEAFEARHFSMFAPRDFDVSPYFAVVKPLPVADFDYTRLRWAD